MPPQERRALTLCADPTPEEELACLEAAVDSCLSCALAAVWTPAQRLLLAQALALLGRERLALQAVQPMLNGVLQVRCRRGGGGRHVADAACVSSST